MSIFHEQTTFDSIRHDKTGSDNEIMIGMIEDIVGVIDIAKGLQ